jgi:CubicO group peptidase (beta-lactamase class C family)
MKSLRPCFAALFVIIAVGCAASASAAEPITAAQIDTLVERTMRAFDVPGIAVAVIKDDKVIHSKGYGVSSLKNRQKVDEHTAFGIASNSKAFTAAALAILVDEKKLKWTDKVIDYIPEFRMYNPYVTEEFTVLDLLTHRSGLGLGAGDLMQFPSGADFTRADVIRNLRYLKPTSGFRSKYDYDNNLYVVAGEVLARASGMSFEEFVEQRIMKKLGMTESAASPKRLKSRANFAYPHAALDGGAVQQIDEEIGDISNAAGGIYTNLVDMSKWVRMQLNAGKYGPNLEQRLFSEQVQWDMWSPQTIVPVGRAANPYNTHFMSYGLGWFLNDMKGYKQVTHTGGLLGMVSQVRLFPELKLGIVVLTNQQSGAAFTAISSTIMDSYLGMPPTDWVSDLRKRVDAREADARKTTEAVRSSIEAAQLAAAAQSIDVSKFAGTFRDPWLGDVDLTLKNGKLYFASKRSPSLSGEMSHYRGNSFVVRWRERSMDADAFVNFSMGNDGTPTGMTMAAISPLTDFSFDFQDLNFQVVKKEPAAQVSAMK